MLLEYLMRNAEESFRKPMIIEHVWEYNFDPQTNIVETRMCRLREKIDKPFEKKLIHTRCADSAMSWNKLKIFNTVKCKVALWYALLFILSSMSLLLLYVCESLRHLLSKENARLEMLARRVSNEFSDGSRYKRLGRDIPLSGFPPIIMRCFSGSFPI